MMRVTPCRLTTLQYSQIGFTLLRTFTGHLGALAPRRLRADEVSHTDHVGWQDFKMFHIA
jgi:hypothetical protein